MRRKVGNIFPLPLKQLVLMIKHIWHKMISISQINDSFGNLSSQETLYLTRIIMDHTLRNIDWGNAIHSSDNLCSCWLLYSMKSNGIMLIFNVVNTIYDHWLIIYKHGCWSFDENPNHIQFVSQCVEFCFRLQKPLPYHTSNLYRSLVVLRSIGVDRLSTAIPWVLND